MIDMKTKDFYFDLPEELVAQHPAETRGGSRLLIYDRKNEYRSHNTSHGAEDRVTHDMVSRLADYIPQDTLMVFNNTRVRKARVYATSDTGSRVEFLFLAPMTSGNPEGSTAHIGTGFSSLPQDQPSDTWQVMVSKTKRQKPGRSYEFPADLKGEIIATEESLRIIRLDRQIDESYFSREGHVPLPPYIEREDDSSDDKRYQTVYASREGSVAAPTAGLHITQSILEALDARGIRRCEITLHVGLGTFLPVRSESILDHNMHSEEYEISEESAELITRQKQGGTPVLAVGTTSVRTLESAWQAEQMRLPSGRNSTDIFIYPGYKFQVVDMLMTNFHTPESTLLMLVSAFAGKDEILRVYREAVDEKYRFFSYGDAMLIR